MGRLSLIMVVYLLGLLALGPADARNVKLFVSIDTALQVDDVDEKPKGGVKFFSGNKRRLRSPDRLEEKSSTARPRPWGRAKRFHVAGRSNTSWRNSREEPGDSARTP